MLRENKDEYVGSRRIHHPNLDTFKRTLNTCAGTTGVGLDCPGMCRHPVNKTHPWSQESTIQKGW